MIIPKKINSVAELVTSIRNSNSEITLFTSGATGFTRKFTHPLKNLIRKINVFDERKKDVWGFAFNPTHVAGVQGFFYGSTETGPLSFPQNDEFSVQEKHIGLVKVVDDELYIHKNLSGKTTQLNLIDDFSTQPEI